ncbi:MAG TPA: M6 family metalloprotease domain-containing protein [Urbifossiella sp.]|jgi:M6 family metalloprotease-like protein
MTRTRLAPTAVLILAIIGTAAAQEKRAVAPAPRAVPLAIAPPPHHDLRGYLPVAKAIAADPKLITEASHAAAGFLGVVIRADSANRPVIEAVERDSPADYAGIHAGDLVLKLDRVGVVSDAEARDILRTRLAGESLSLQLMRNGKRLEVSATLIPTSQPKHTGPRAVMGINVVEPSVKGTGAKVDAVSTDMPAAKSGVKIGDLITKLDGHDVFSPEKFREMMATRRPGDTVDLLLERGGKREGARITLIPEGGTGFGGRGWDDRLAGYWQKPTYKLAILGVEYPDVKHNPKIEDKHWEESMFSIGTYNGKSATGETVHGSMNDYYKELSHGTFKIDGKFIGWVEAKKKRMDYSTGSGTDTGEKLNLLTEALDKYVDKHGKDSLKEYDGIFFLYAGGRVQTTRGGLYWPHRANVTHKGRRLPYFIVQEGGNRMTDISVFCHEFGHMLGLPDLYARPELPGSEGAWVWCAMSNQNGGGKPQHFCAWSKEMLGWVKPTVIDPRVPQKLVLSPVEDDPTQCLKVLVRPDRSEYFLLENRARKGFDEALPAGGLLIWRVVNNRPVLEESHGVDGANGPRSFLDEVPYPSKANNSFTPYTTPSSKSQLGGGLPVYITNIRRLPGDRISFQIGYEFQ